MKHFVRSRTKQLRLVHYCCLQRCPSKLLWCLATKHNGPFLCQQSGFRKRCFQKINWFRQSKNFEFESKWRIKYNFWFLSEQQPSNLQRGQIAAICPADASMHSCLNSNAGENLQRTILKSVSWKDWRASTQVKTDSVVTIRRIYRTKWSCRNTDQSTVSAWSSSKNTLRSTHWRVICLGYQIAKRATAVWAESKHNGQILGFTFRNWALYGNSRWGFSHKSIVKQSVYYDIPINIFWNWGRH